MKPTGLVWNSCCEMVDRMMPGLAAETATLGAVHPAA
jgi:hypothetical protein